MLMASRQILNPYALLRVSPVVTATCSLWFAWDQHFFLGIFASPEHRAKSNQFLPQYFKTFFTRGLPRVVALLFLTITGGIANLYVYPHSLRETGARPWYIAGSMFAVAHFCFVPVIAPSIKAIVEDKSQGDSTSDLENWLSINSVRALTVDLGAWVTLVVAVVRSARI